MKKHLLGLLLLSAASAQAVIPDMNTSCRENLFNGVTLEGEEVKFCQLENGNVRYTQLEKDYDRPVVSFDIPASQSFFFLQETDERVTKTLVVNDPPLLLHLTYQTVKNRQTGKWVPGARVLRFFKGELTGVDRINVNSLTYKIDHSLLDKGITELSEN